MLADGTRTGTASYGSSTDYQRAPEPGYSAAVAADERDGGRGTLDRTAANLPLSTIARPDLTDCSGRPRAFTIPTRTPGVHRPPACAAVAVLALLTAATAARTSNCPP